MKTNNYNPFLLYSQQLQELLQASAKQKDPALWLYKNDVRTTLFMLEALTRLHNKAFEEDLFEKWNKRFKKLEDVFGQIDEFASLEKKFKKDKNVSQEVIKYYKIQKDNLIEKCNQRLTEKDWLDIKMLTFDRKLNELNLNYDTEYVIELKNAIVNEVDEILYFTLKSNYHFTKIEEQVHELRRKLRWLSIYAQALRGLIQLKKSVKRKKYEINYFTHHTINSPFNKLVAKPANISIIEFDADSFLALSWLIDELGKFKDIVLNLYQLRDGLYVTNNFTKEEAIKNAISIMDLKLTVEEDVLKEASHLIKVFIFKDKVLDDLMVK